MHIIRGEVAIIFRVPLGSNIGMRQRQAIRVRQFSWHNHSPYQHNVLVTRGI